MNVIDILSRLFFPRQQSRVVRLDLPAGYHDIDQRLLYASFGLLTEFVEQEMAAFELQFQGNWRWYHDLLGVRDAQLGFAGLKRRIDAWMQRPAKERYEGEFKTLSEDAGAATEIGQLYMWWKYMRALDIENVDKAYLAYDADTDSLYEMETQLTATDTAMLQRLLTVRTYLWT